MAEITGLANINRAVRTRLIEQGHRNLVARSTINNEFGAGILPRTRQVMSIDRDALLAIVDRYAEQIGSQPYSPKAVKTLYAGLLPHLSKGLTEEQQVILRDNVRAARATELIDHSGKRRPGLVAIRENSEVFKATYPARAAQPPESPPSVAEVHPVISPEAAHEITPPPLHVEPVATETVVTGGEEAAHAAEAARAAEAAKPAEQTTANVTENAPGIFKKAGNWFLKDGEKLHYGKVAGVTGVVLAAGTGLYLLTRKTKEPENANWQEKVAASRSAPEQQTAMG